jgi:hypothetical protein
MQEHLLVRVGEVEAHSYGKCNGGAKEVLMGEMGGM